jgi:hypothetical protein
MFDKVMVAEHMEVAHAAMRRYADLRRLSDRLEALTNQALGEAVGAYEWLDEVPEPDRPDEYKPSHIGGRCFWEDLVGELTVANRCSQGVAEITIHEVSTLTHDLPQCWEQVINPSVAAPRWQAARIAGKCIGLDHEQYAAVDARVAPGLGMLGWGRLSRMTSAAVKRADPQGARLQAKRAERFVHTSPDSNDPLSGVMVARIDRADAIFLDATIQLLADTAIDPAVGTVDQRRAKAFGMLANPAQVIQALGVYSTRGLDPIPQTQADVAAIVATADKLAPAFTPRTQLYVHVYESSLTDPDGIARVEGIGPVLMDQVKQLTGTTRVRVSRIINTADDISVDSYDIPDQIREQVLARHPHVIAPWSSMESRHQDLDHIHPYQLDEPGQTRAANLAPQSRSSHRWKTHAGWHVDICWPGAHRWETAAGQIVYVDQHGTHPVRRQ